MPDDQHGTRTAPGAPATGIQLVDSEEIAVHRPPRGRSSSDPFIIGPAPLDPGAKSGPLVGLSFAAKDLFDVAGTRTGCGNPSRLADAPVARSHARAVSALIDSGARLAGKTVTDELAFSLSGTNVHYGTPINPAAPGRIPGGSSSGSASAVASGLVDFALGTDTGGSVRVPASYCGLFGLRTTHGRISHEGVMLLAPSFCTVGLFAARPGVLSLAWQVLRDGAVTAAITQPPREMTSLVLAPELFELADLDAKSVLREAAEDLGHHLGVPCRVASFATRTELDVLRDTFRTIQLFEAWQVHGAWLSGGDRGLGPGVASRFHAASLVRADDALRARAAREIFRARFDEFLGEGAYLIQPATSGPAPLIEQAPAEKEDVRTRTLGLTAIAGLAGAPVISLPLCELNDAPMGLCIVGKPGGDDVLVELAQLVSDLA